MKSLVSRLALGVSVAAMMLFEIGCGGGGSSSPTPNPNPQLQDGTVTVLVGDDSTEDWATIGVKVLSVSLTPQVRRGSTPAQSSRAVAPPAHVTRTVPSQPFWNVAPSHGAPVPTQVAAPATTAHVPPTA